MILSSCARRILLLLVCLIYLPCELTAIFLAIYQRSLTRAEFRLPASTQSQFPPAKHVRSNNSHFPTCPKRNGPHNALLRHSHHLVPTAVLPTMFLKPLVVVAAFVSSAQFVVSWGADTHPTIGYLAERFLLNETVPPCSARHVGVGGH